MLKLRRCWIRLFLPTFIILTLTWLITGCIYVPFFEHRLEDGPNVRALVGDARSGRPIRPLAVTRHDVIAMLGEPRWISDNGLAIAYVARTGISSWLYPQCAFIGEPADAKSYIVRLIFNQQGQLIRYDWEDEIWFRSPTLMFGPIAPPGLDAAVIEKLNRTGPLLHSNPQNPYGPSTAPTR